MSETIQNASEKPEAEKTVKLKVIYKLSEQGQRAALAQGKLANKLQIETINLPFKYLDYDLVRITRLGEGFLFLTIDSLTYSSVTNDSLTKLGVARDHEKHAPFDSPLSVDDLLSLIEINYQIAIFKESERERISDTFLKNPEHGLYVYFTPEFVWIEDTKSKTGFRFEFKRNSQEWNVENERIQQRKLADFINSGKPPNLPSTTDGYFGAILFGEGLEIKHKEGTNLKLDNDHAATVEARRRRAELEARMASYEQERLDREAALEEEKKQKVLEATRKREREDEQLRYFISLRGDTLMRERMEAGFMQREEMIQLLKEYAFQWATTNKLPLYKDLEWSDIIHDSVNGCRCPGIDRTDIPSPVIENVTSLTNEEWEHFKPIKEYYGYGKNYSVKLEQVSFKCGLCEQSVSRKKAKVTVTDSEFTFNRNFAI